MTASPDAVRSVGPAGRLRRVVGAAGWLAPILAVFAVGRLLAEMLFRGTG